MTQAPGVTIRKITTPRPAVDTDLVVVGTSIDPHIDAVLAALSVDIRVARLDVDRFPRTAAIGVHLQSGKSSVFLEASGQTFNVSTPGIVWFRRLGQPSINPQTPAKYRQFVIGEAEQALEAALSLMNAKSWINEYWPTRKAANKPYQYSVAASSGLSVPDTLVTNDPDRARSWIADHPDVIAKTLHSPVIVNENGYRRFVFTSRLSTQDRDDLDDVAIAPCQFQPVIDRTYEVRVTTIGSKHFGVRIDELNERSEILDWRSDEYECVYSKIEVPLDVAESLNTLLKTLGIVYAASDFIVTNSDEWIFLECNPHGAWLWLEKELPSLGITEAIALHIENCLR